MMKSDERKNHALSGSRRRGAATRASRANVARDNGPTRDEIAQRAYFLWIEKGQPAGQDLDCWCEAEAELRGRRRETADESDDS